MNFGDIIREKRKSKGISMEKLARESCVSYNTILNIELNRIVPTLTILTKVCDVLDMEICIKDKG